MIDVKNNHREVMLMSTKFKNTKKKMASLGLRKNENGDYTYIDSNDKNSEFVPVRKKQNKSDS
jgi:hypothetical protein